MYAVSTNWRQARFYVAAGAIFVPKPRPCPRKCFSYSGYAVHRRNDTGNKFPMTTGAKNSVLSPSKYAKMRFRAERSPEPRWGSSRRSPRSPSPLERGYSYPCPTPLCTFGARHAAPFAPRFGGGHCYQYFPLKPRLPGEYD